MSAHSLVIMGSIVLLIEYHPPTLNPLSNDEGSFYIKTIKSGTRVSLTSDNVDPLKKKGDNTMSRQRKKEPPSGYEQDLKRLLIRNNDGRRPSLTYDTIDKICTMLRRGHFEDTILDFLGIPQSTYKIWLKKGQDAELLLDQLEKTTYTEEEIALMMDKEVPNWILYLSLILDTKKAGAESEIEISNHILLKARKNFNAATYVLERRHKARWSATSKVEIGADYSSLDNFLNGVKQLAEATLDKGKEESTDGEQDRL